MTHPSPPDRASAAPAAPSARRLLGHLTAALPRGGRPAPRHLAEPSGRDRPSDVRQDDAFWWEVVRGTAPLGSLGVTVPAPTVAPERRGVAAPSPAVHSAAVVSAAVRSPAVHGPVVPVERPSLARAEGWLTARAGAVAAPPAPGTGAAAPAAHRAPPVPAPTMPAPTMPAPAMPAPAMPAPAPAVATPAADVAVARPVPAVPSPAPATGSPTGPELLLGDGRRVPLITTLLVGRNPAPRAGEVVGALVAVDDPARSVSKTHLLVGADASGVWVVDRHSTNGTVVTLPDGQLILAVPERRVRLVSGAAVRFGDHGFTLVVGEDRP